MVPPLCKGTWIPAEAGMTNIGAAHTRSCGKMVSMSGAAGDALRVALLREPVRR